MSFVVKKTVQTTKNTKVHEGGSPSANDNP